MSTDQPDLPERFDLRSADPLAERIDVLRATFPEAFREGKVDVDALTRSLGEWVDPGPERFGLTWPGKAECMRVIQEPSLGALVPMPEESVDWDTTQNVIIEGENLEVLKLLQKAYYGKVKMIYIDPPYNTGREFIYPDNFREGLADYLKYSGQVDDAGFKTSANTEAGGRYHSKWLSMMYPRLFLARNLLREDGVIFVTIDDHEVQNLRMLLNEIFGEENFVATAAWQKTYVSNMTAKHFSQTHDSVVIYARNAEQAAFGEIERTAEQLAKYTNPDNDPRGDWKAENLSAGKFYSAGMFSITTPSGRVVDPPPGRYWRCNQKQYDKWLSEGRISFGRDGAGRPMLKKYRSEIAGGLTPSTWWTHQEYGSNKEASLELKELFGGESPFDTPKPTKLVRRLLELSTESDDLVLDFFAGSGTSGEAVAQLNWREESNRRYIAVQLPEPTINSSLPTISSIVRQRARLVQKKLHASGSGPSSSDTGFRAFRLSASGLRTWDTEYTSMETLAEQLQMAVEGDVERRSSDNAVVFELLLKAGYPLTTTPEKVVLTGEVVAHSINNGALLIFIGEALALTALENMITLSPSMIIISDTAFTDDEQKVNALQAVRAYNRREETDLTLRIV